jgi:anaphase-promoting complex subunit 4
LRYSAIKESISQKQLPHGKPSKITSFLTMNNTEMSPFIQHTFPAEERFKPLQIEVNGRKNRRFVAVIAEDLRHLRIFDLDFKAEEENHARIQDSDDNDLMEE